MEHSTCEGKRAQVVLPKTERQHLYDNTTAPAHQDRYQKKRDTGNVLMVFVTTLVAGYAPLDDVGVHE